jgi:hypothetical protein
MTELTLDRRLAELEDLEAIRRLKAVFRQFQVQLPFAKFVRTGRR